MIRNVFVFVVLLLFGTIVTLSRATAQNMLRGSVSGEAHDEHEGEGHEGEGHGHRLAFANVYWVGATAGVTTDEFGEFKIERNQDGENRLVASYVGYQSDTILVKEGQKRLEFMLEPHAELGEVVINESIEGSYISKIKPIKTEIISEGGLQKLACCNLSESFENSATVDVGYSDAVSGAKKIQMLGLSGIYSQLLTENVPSIRGLASNYGLSYIPGSWMQSIQVSKGTSAVITGYESTSGQINVEYKKPEHTKEKLFVNLYGNSEAKTEGNINAVFKVSERVSTMLLTHASFNLLKMDNNKDGFLDIPLGWQVNVVNRWTFEAKKGGHTQLLLNYMQEKRQGGQTSYYNPPEGSGFLYGTEIETRRVQAILKSGWRFNKPYQSLGLISALTWHNQQAMFGKRDYSGDQKSGYANLIYQTIISNSNHLVSAGASFMLDDYRESLNDSVFNHTEWVPGAFFQYTYNHLENFSLILGLRADYNNIYQFLLTPRLHVKWNITDHTVLRASGGRGYRSPNAIAENTSLLASNRILVFREDLRIEEAWNYGLNITQDFYIDEDRKITLSADFYRTDFTNRMVIDLDENVQRIYFYNLSGRSYSNSFQFDFSIQPLKRFDMALAFRWNDSKTDFGGIIRETPFVSKYKGLLTLSYATRYEKWKFDVTAQYNGRSRLPLTDSSPEVYARGNWSREYYMLHAQVTKKWRLIDLYVGAENLLNVKQKNPIVSADNPESPYFDASMIWGPLSGRMFYAGLRLKINK